MTNDPVDYETAERLAREAVELAITRFGDRDASHDEWVPCVAALDAYRTAILDAERARVRAVVEGAPNHRSVNQFEGCTEHTDAITRADLLAALAVGA